MHKVIITLVSLFLLAACTSTKVYQEGDYIDLTDNRDAVNNYFSPEIRIAPSYPLDAARSGQTGCVTLAYVIDEEGKPQDIEIVHSYPQGVFERNAREAMSYFRWQPVDGKPVELVSTTTTLIFEIEGVSDPKTQRACGSA